MKTRDEFEKVRLTNARLMNANKSLKNDALKVLSEADKNYWIHQSNWLGEPCLQLPQDMFALQEIIYRTRPENLIETGVAWGGSLLFYATLFEILGLPGKIIGVDIYIPSDLIQRLQEQKNLWNRIELIEASSTDKKAEARIREIIKDSIKNMVILDSHHTHNHVLDELKLYSEFVGLDYYLVCGDTVVEDLPLQKHRPREWGPGNSPKTALNEFLSKNKDFEIDEDLESKLLFTCNPSGYLKRVK